MIHRQTNLYLTESAFQINTLTHDHENMFTAKISQLYTCTLIVYLTLKMLQYLSQCSSILSSPPEFHRFLELSRLLLVLSLYLFGELLALKNVSLPHVFLFKCITPHLVVVFLHEKRRGCLLNTLEKNLNKYAQMMQHGSDVCCVATSLTVPSGVDSASGVAACGKLL